MLKLVIRIHLELGKEIDRLGKNWNSKCYNDATHFLPMEKADSVTEDIIEYIKDFL